MLNVEDFKNIPLETILNIKENLDIDLVEYYKNNKKVYNLNIINKKNMKPGKIIVMYNGKGKSYITKAFTEYFWEVDFTPNTMLWEDERNKWNDKIIKRDLKLGDSFLIHSEESDIKEIKKILGIALSRRSYFIDMSYNK